MNESIDELFPPSQSRFIHISWRLIREPPGIFNLGKLREWNLSTSKYVKWNWRDLKATARWLVETVDYSQPRELWKTGPSWLLRSVILITEWHHRIIIIDIMNSNEFFLLIILYIYLYFTTINPVKAIGS